jgi:hypothetical protein
MKTTRKLLLFASLTLALASCDSAKQELKPFIKLPKGNLALWASDKEDSLNSKANESAYFRRPNNRDIKFSTNIERLKSVGDSAFDGVKISKYFFRDIFRDSSYNKNKEIFESLTNNLESVSFITRESGFASIAHAPDSAFSANYDLPIKPGIGGSDIYYFDDKTGKFIFTALPDSINSIYWDSHPFAVADSNGAILLLWSSDRHNPYSATYDISMKTIKKGDADIYYAFKKNGIWSSPKSFEYNTGINSTYYEICPFIACADLNPTLFFSSNRDGDYDIYSAPLHIDFKNQTLSAIAAPTILSKGDEKDLNSEFINTKSNEFFPTLKADGAQAYLYLTSNRNQNPIPANSNADTLVQAKGSYDVYRLNYAYDCAPPPDPRIRLSVKLIDKLEPNKAVLESIIKLVDKASGKEIIRKGATNELFDLEWDKEYEVFGGSSLKQNPCDNTDDSTLLHYNAIKVSELKPIIQKKTINIAYDSLIAAQTKTSIDTLEFFEWRPASNLKDISPQKNIKSERNIDGNHVKTISDEFIKEIKFRDEVTRKEILISGKIIGELPAGEKFTSLVQVFKTLVNRNEWLEGGRKIKVHRDSIYFDTTYRYDSTMFKIDGATAKSELCALGTISTKRPKKETLIEDQVYLYPEYFVKPPCSCDFATLDKSFNKYVPYFQTAFWKVNTSAGLTEQLEDFQEGGYLQSSGFIELHPKHRKYGVHFKEARERRKEEYRDYAKKVDFNLAAMRDEIVKRFIPAMRTLDSLGSNNKLLIKVEAYSDIRDAGLCYYTGSTVNFLQGKTDRNSFVKLNEISIRNQASLGDDNDNLSKLRVYYGFLELLKKLKADPEFKSYIDRGLVFIPTEDYIIDAAMDKIAKAKIVFLIEGKYYDPTKKSNEEDYDAIRRLNLFINLIKYEGGHIESSPCCNAKGAINSIRAQKKR